MTETAPSHDEVPGLQPARFYLPAPSADWPRWAVIACDQYTSQPEKWKRTEDLVGDAPSTLRLILPEIYLDRPDTAARIEDVRRTMGDYLESGILQPTEPGFILVDRSTPHTPSRRGLLAAVDLEDYSFDPGTETLVRPTEKTILERIPPRIRIRRGAPLELPHIMLLINDPDRQAIEPLFRKTPELTKLYDFELLEGRGHVSGWFLPADLGKKELAAPLAGLIHDRLLYAVGDGNHSLATAKSYWEELKRDLPPEEQADHPARYALAEIVNIQGDGVPFEPIHRLLSGVAPRDLEDFLVRRSGAREIQSLPADAPEEEIAQILESLPETAGDELPGDELQPRTAAVISREGARVYTFPLDPGDLLIEKLQPLLDAYLQAHTSAGRTSETETETESESKSESKPKTEPEIDFIHGTKELISLARKQTGDTGRTGTAAANRAGIFLPPIDKDSFFSSAARKGPLPRKTFSMGEAEEKRFYIESRRIIP